MHSPHPYPSPFLRRHLILIAVALYATVGVLLRAYTPINILPPCLWHSLFGIRCPGCGITTAWVHLLRGEWHKALHIYPLALPIVVGMVVAVIWNVHKERQTLVDTTGA